MATALTHDAITVRKDMAGRDKQSKMSIPISAKAKAGWLACERAVGAPTFTSLMEAIGLRLEAGEKVCLDDEGLGAEAREINRERKGRPKG